MDDPRALIEVELAWEDVLRPLRHHWPTPAGLGVCLATWQQEADGQMYAECLHYRYVVRYES